MTTEDDNIQCEHRPIRAFGQGDSPRCEYQAVVVAGRPEYDDARLLCGEHLIAGLHGVSRTAAFSGDRTGEMTAVAGRMQQAERDLIELTTQPDYDGEEWSRLNDITKNARQTLIAAIRHM